MTSLEDELALQPRGEIRSELTLLGRWLMHEVEIERNITHILEREGDKLGDHETVCDQRSFIDEWVDICLALVEPTAPT